MDCWGYFSRPPFPQMWSWQERQAARFPSPQWYLITEKLFGGFQVAFGYSIIVARCTCTPAHTVPASVKVLWWARKRCHVQFPNSLNSQSLGQGNGKKRVESNPHRIGVCTPDDRLPSPQQPWVQRHADGHCTAPPPARENFRILGDIRLWIRL